MPRGPLLWATATLEVAGLFQGDFKGDFCHRHTLICMQVVENWTYSLFFCVAELWGAVVISVLFWTLANEVCTIAGNACSTKCRCSVQKKAEQVVHVASVEAVQLGWEYNN